MAIMEDMLRSAFKTVLNVDLPKPFRAWRTPRPCAVTAATNLTCASRSN